MCKDFPTFVFRNGKTYEVVRVSGSYKGIGSASDGSGLVMVPRWWRDLTGVLYSGSLFKVCSTGLRPVRLKRAKTLSPTNQI